MCKCTPASRTPFCGKLNCEWPGSKPDGARAEAPVKPGAIEAIRDVKRYHWYRDGMWCADTPLPGDPFPTVGIWVQASAYDQQTLALEGARRERDNAVDLAGTRARRIDELLLAEVQYWRALKEAREALGKYGDHRYGCDVEYNGTPGHWKCTCGFAAALSPTKAGTGGT